MTFDSLYSRFTWQPIRDCPGRFILRGVTATVGLVDLLDETMVAQRFDSVHAKDAVWVARFDDGGVISYQRGDGTWLHTLCTPAGLKRKLRQLEIPYSDS